MSYKPTSNDPDLETIGRYLVALGTWCEAAFPTMKMLGAHALELARHSKEAGDEDQADVAEPKKGKKK